MEIPVSFDSRKTVIECLLALLSSALALYFATGLHPFWWLMWVAPVPVLLLAPRVSTGVAFLVAFLAKVVGIGHFPKNSSET